MIDFNKLIDQHITREYKPKKIGNYYPSEIGRCMRKIWYSYMRPQDVEPDLRKVFEVGHIMHDFVVDVLKSEKTHDVELLKAEMPLKFHTDYFTISGRVDDLILLKIDGRMILVEVKSTRNISMVKRAEPSHTMQLQFYMLASGVHNGIILYIDKTNLNTKIFEIKFDEEEGTKILKRFEELHNYLVENELPFAEAKQMYDMNWMCRYCEYKSKCDKDEK